jgi:hypothetical protein
MGWLPFGYVASAVFRFFQWNTDILVIVVLGWVPFMSVFSWQWAFWRCPRCGYAFKARYEFFFSKALPLLRASNVGGIARPIGTQREFLNSLVCRVTGNLKIHMDGNRVCQELALFGLYFRYGTPHSR